MGMERLDARKIREISERALKSDNKGDPRLAFPGVADNEEAGEAVAKAVKGFPRLAASAGVATGLFMANPADSQEARFKSITELIQRDMERADRRSGFEKMPEDAVRCMTDNIYHEARGEKAGEDRKDGWRAVMLVTLGRQLFPGYPKTTCGVVHQKKQFSWTFDKRILAQPIDQKKYVEIRAFVEDELRHQDAASAVTLLSLQLRLPAETLFYKVKGFKGSEKVQEFFGSLESIGIIGNHEFFVERTREKQARR